MVEGPGCKVKGEKMKPRIKGQVVTAVAGNAVEKYTKIKRGEPPNDAKLSPFHGLLGKECHDVKTLGKELFIFFKDHSECLRLHFLMSGGFRLNGENIDGDRGGEANTSTLILTLSRDTLTFNKSAAELRSASQSIQRIYDFHSLDICADSFSLKRAVALILEQQERQICDVLLDQAILPGVGNIIKNEAMFDSGIKPSTTVKELTSEHISHLVKMTRDFSMLFYKCRKENKALQPHLKIYRKAECKECGGKVTNTRMGDDSGRLTSFCVSCQTNENRFSKKLKLATKTSLLGWIRSGQVVATAPEQWSCSQCTLLNDSTAVNCTLCYAYRIKPTPDFSKKVGETANEKCSLKRVASFSPDCSQTHHKITRYSLGNVTTNTNTYLPLAKSSTKLVDRKAIEVTYCPEHKCPCIMREVRKKSPNLGRMFWCCSARGRCNFFQWADESFPICEGHGKRCSIRTVLKEGSNNGRKFFACGQPKTKQCQFFQWADEYHKVTIR